MISSEAHLRLKSDPIKIERKKINFSQINFASLFSQHSLQNFDLVSQIKLHNLRENIKEMSKPGKNCWNFIHLYC